MEGKLQIVFLIASLGTFVYIISMIRKKSLNIDNAIVWILWSILLLILSIFPGIPAWISNTLGFMSPSNFIICMFIFFLYIMFFSITIRMSKIEEKLNELIQKLSIKEYEEKKLKEKENENK